MGTFTFFCVLFLLVGLQKSEQAPTAKECKAFQNQVTRKQLQGLPWCIKKLKYSGKEKSKKMNCIIRCVMIKEHFLDEDGTSSLESFNKYLTTAIPPNFQEHFNNTMWNCVEQAFVGLKPPEEDEYCTSYDAFIKCTMGKAAGFCSGLE